MQCNQRSQSYDYRVKKPATHKKVEIIKFEISISKEVSKTIEFDVYSDPKEAAMKFCKENDLPSLMRDRLHNEISRYAVKFLLAKVG